MIPTIQPGTHPESLPFLLVRPNAPVELKSDVLEEDGVTEEIPCSRSVPPHAPPAPMSTTEHELPSVIVDPCALGGEAMELQRGVDVDGLLTASQPVDFAIPVHEQPADDDNRVTRRNPAPRVRSTRGKGFAIAMVAALMAAGGTFAGLRVYHGNGFPLSAAAHFVR